MSGAALSFFYASGMTFMVHDPVEDDAEVVRVVVYTNYVDDSFEELVHKVLPVSFGTVKLFVFGGEQAQPDQSFCKEFVDRHGGASISSVNLGQRQARLQDAFAVKHSVQLQQTGPQRRTRVGGQSQAQSVTLTHKRNRDNDSEGQSAFSNRTRGMSTSRGAMAPR